MKILITGASRGIGLFLMQELLKQGHEAEGIFHNTLPLEELKPFLTKVDITDELQVQEWVKRVVKPKDKIVLINCAGTNYNAFAHKAKLQLWRNVIDINLIGSFSAINAVLPFMREKNFGRIINFSSVVAQKGIAGTSAYAASKAAMWGMTKSIAVENASKGITINNLNLGYFSIGMIKDVPEEMLSIIKKNIPVQQLGAPIDILNTINYLIDTAYITGTSIDVNGGLH